MNAENRKIVISNLIFYGVICVVSSIGFYRLGYSNGTGFYSRWDMQENCMVKEFKNKNLISQQSRNSNLDKVIKISELCSKKFGYKPTEDATKRKWGSIRSSVPFYTVRIKVPFGTKEEVSITKEWQRKELERLRNINLKGL